MQDRSRLQPQLGTFDPRMPHVAAASGSCVTLADGRRLVDLNSGYWNVPLGYGRRSVIRAATRAFAKLSYGHLYRRTHEPAAQLANMLAEITPPGTCAKVLFSNDGTGATETALRLVMRWASEYRPADTIVTLKLGYHGDSLVVRQLGDYPTGEPRVRLPKLRVRKVTAPAAADEPFGSGAAVLQRLADNSRLAAFFCEIVQGVAGMRPIHGDFLRFAQALCRRSGALFVVDEVATGFGRTGRMFAFEHHDLTPDLVLVGKGLTNGFFPLAAVMVSERVIPILSREFQHGHTTSGHPVGCEIAVAAIQEVLDGDLSDRANRLSRDVMSILQNDVGRPTVGGHIRGLGLFLGFHVGTSRRASQLRRAIEERGIWVGQEAAVLTIVPPLTIPRRILMSSVETVREMIASLQNR